MSSIPHTYAEAFDLIQNAMDQSNKRSWYLPGAARAAALAFLDAAKRGCSPVEAACGTLDHYEIVDLGTDPCDAWAMSLYRGHLYMLSTADA